MIALSFLAGFITSVVLMIVMACCAALSRAARAEEQWAPWEEDQR